MLLFHTAKMNFKKSQVSIEFSFLVGLAFLVLIIFLASISSKTKDMNRDKEQIMVTDLGYKIQSEVNLAFRAENGYYREFTLPDDLDGVNYSIIVNRTIVIVQGRTEDFLVTVANFTGSIGRGTNKICKNGDAIFIGNSYC